MDIRTDGPTERQAVISVLYTLRALPAQRRSAASPAAEYHCVLRRPCPRTCSPPPPLPSTGNKDPADALRKPGVRRLPDVLLLRAAAGAVLQKGERERYCISSDWSHRGQTECTPPCGGLSVRSSVRPSVNPSLRSTVCPSVCPSVRPSVGSFDLFSSARRRTLQVVLSERIFIRQEPTANWFVPVQN